MPDAHDLEARVQLLERALAKLLGTDDFEAFLAQSAPATTNLSASTTHAEAPAPQLPLGPAPASQAAAAPQDKNTPPETIKVTNASSPRREAPPVRRLLPRPRGRLRHRLAQRREERLVTRLLRPLRPEQPKPQTAYSTGHRAAPPPR